MTENNNRVCCLYRVSTDKQVDFNSNHEADLPMQRKACHKFAESKGWVIVHEEQEEGVSGHKVRAAARDKLQVIKDYARRGKFDILLVFMFDASKGMVQWAKENAVKSGLADKPVRWLVDDCVKFVQREQRRGNKYDGIIMDPPSYGRGPGGEVWKLEEQLYSLVELCMPILSDDALFFILNSYTTGLSPAVMEYLLGVMLKKRFGGKVSSSEIGLHVTESGMTLPCGSTAIWEK